MTRFAVIILIIGLLSFSLCPRISHTYGLKTIDQHKAQIKKRDHELLQLEKKRRNMADNGSIILGELNTLDSRLRTLDQNIYEHKQKIEQINAQVAQLNQSLKIDQQKISQRMRDIYLKKEVNRFIQATSVKDAFVQLKQMYIHMKQDEQNRRRFQEKSIRLEDVRKRLVNEQDKLLKEQKQAKKYLRSLKQEVRRTKWDQRALRSKEKQLEQENEKAQSIAFYLLQKKIQKVSEQEIMQGKSMVYRGGTFCWPVDRGRITSPFGYRFHPLLKVKRLHRGVDIGGGFGAPIKAASSGKVIESRPSSGYGYIVVLYHGGHLSTLYGHMYGSTVRVNVGDFVHKGQVIASVGSNGWSTGPHLHFEVLQNGQVRDPMRYFRGYLRR